MPAAPSTAWPGVRAERSSTTLRPFTSAVVGLPSVAGPPPVCVVLPPGELMPPVLEELLEELVEDVDEDEALEVELEVELELDPTLELELDPTLDEDELVDEVELLEEFIELELDALEPIEDELELPSSLMSFDVLLLQADRQPAINTVRRE